MDDERAAILLDEVLSHWKKGGTIAELRNLKAPVIVQDTDWINGLKLTEFRIAEKVVRDANLIVQVELTLTKSDDPSDDSNQKRSVEYIVSTNPVLTVFRNMMN